MELGHSRILSLQHRASFDEALRTNYVFLSTCCYTAGCVEMGVSASLPPKKAKEDVDADESRHR